MSDENVGKKQICKHLLKGQTSLNVGTRQGRTQVKPEGKCSPQFRGIQSGKENMLPSNLIHHLINPISLS